MVAGRNELLHPVETIYQVMKQKNAEFAGPAGNSAKVEEGISLLRSSHEESYKQLISPMIAYFLNRVTAINDEDSLQRVVSLFNANTVPDISIGDYLSRIVKYYPCSAECYLLCLIFMDKLANSQRIRVNSHNVHRLLLTSILISSKLLDDSTCCNKYAAHTGGMPIKELNQLERSFLSLLNYELHVDTFTFELYRYELEFQLVCHLEPKDSEVTISDILKWQDNKLQTTQDLAHLKMMRLRRSRSFNTNTPNIPKRKNRSTSFTILSMGLAGSTSS